MKTIQRSLRHFLKTSFLLLSLGLVAPDSASAFGQVINPTTPSAFIPTPSRGPVGAVIEVTGLCYDKDKNGNAWTGSPPYQVRFKGAAGPTAVNAAFTVLSPGKLRVTVPAGALTGKISIVQGTYTQSSVFSFTVVPPATPSFLKIQNNSQYNLISVKVNNVETLSPGNGVPPATFMNLPREPGACQVSVVMGITTDAPLFFFNGSATVTAGATATFTTPRVTINQLMTNFSPVKDWKTDILFDNNLNPYQRLIRLRSNGTYQIFDSSSASAVESGNYSQMSWPNNSSSVSFRLGARTVSISLPFGRFLTSADRGNRTTLFTRQ